jgi:RNA binding exosome subunit
MFHSVELRAHVHATEDETRVERAMRTLSPDGTIESEAAEGVHGNPIVLKRLRIQTNEAITAFWGRLKAAGLLEKVLEDLDARVDEDVVLHLRFDKQAAHRGSIEPARTDDVISVRAKIAAHPAKKSVAVRIAREYFRRL